MFAGFVTGLTTALLILIVKTIFFYADTGYPDFNRADAAGKPIPPYCHTGADCVYKRYVALGRDADLRAAGVVDGASFGTVYWNQQFAVAGALLLATTAGGLAGAGLYGVFRSKPTGQGQDRATSPVT